MSNKLYLQNYDDSNQVEMVSESKEMEMDARAYCECIYIPWMIFNDPSLFTQYLGEQGPAFIYDVYERSFELFDEDFTFSKDDFDIVEYTFKEDGLIDIIKTPEKNVMPGHFKYIILAADTRKEEIELGFMSVEKADDGADTINIMDLESFVWECKGTVEDDYDDIAEHALEIYVEKFSPYSQKVIIQCPLCGNKFGLGLTEEEYEGYQRYQNEDEDLDDAISTLNLFEKEFLLTGMCPNCQSNVFGKEMPTDISRWTIVEYYGKG